MDGDDITITIEWTIPSIEDPGDVLKPSSGAEQ